MREKTRYYHVCPYCGDHLDPGERCACQDGQDKPRTTERTEEHETNTETGRTAATAGRGDLLAAGV